MNERNKAMEFVDGVQKDFERYLEELPGRIGNEVISSEQRIAIEQSARDACVRAADQSRTFQSQERLLRAVEECRVFMPEQLLI